MLGFWHCMLDGCNLELILLLRQESIELKCQPVWSRHSCWTRLFCSTVGWWWPPDYIMLSSSCGQVFITVNALASVNKLCFFCWRFCGYDIACWVCDCSSWYKQHIFSPFWIDTINLVLHLANPSCILFLDLCILGYCELLRTSEVHK